MTQVRYRENKQNKIKLNKNKQRNNKKRVEGELFMDYCMAIAPRSTIARRCGSLPRTEIQMNFLSVPPKIVIFSTVIRSHCLYTKKKLQKYLSRHNTKDTTSSFKSQNSYHTRNITSGKCYAMYWFCLLIVLSWMI